MTVAAMPGDLGSRLVLGLVLSLFVAAGALWWRTLSPSGAAGATAAGTLVCSFDGLSWAAPMVVFFVSSSVLSGLGRERKRALVAAAAKEAQRDLAQVVANGGIATLLAVLAGASGRAALLFHAYLGALAAVSADTWSTEIGGLSRRAPRLITTLATVPPGTSGAVTPLGLLAAVVGGVSISAVGWLSQRLDAGPAACCLACALVLGALAGLAGSLVDSVLGATLQEVRWCPMSGVSTEQAVHRCGVPSVPDRGWRGLNNDAVNALASLAGVPVGLLVASLARAAAHNSPVARGILATGAPASARRGGDSRGLRARWPLAQFGQHGLWLLAQAQEDGGVELGVAAHLGGA
jgi:uncharacterized protein (TIGR00297 family)